MAVLAWPQPDQNGLLKTSVLCGGVALTRR